MLQSSLLSTHSVTMPDKDLENCINSCIAELATSSLSLPETIQATLTRLELGIAAHAKSLNKLYFNLFKSSRPIKNKKHILKLLYQDAAANNAGIMHILKHYRQLFEQHSELDDNTYQCTAKFNPMVEVTQSILNEMIRINAYEDLYTNSFKTLLATLHESIGYFHYFVKNHAAATLKFNDMLTVADAIADDDELKETFLNAGNILIFVDCFLKQNNLIAAASILRMEREKCSTESAQLYYGSCIELANKYALQTDYPNAITWINAALNLHESFELNIKLGDLMTANVDAMAEYLLTIDKEAFIDQELPDLRSSKRVMTVSDYQVTIPVAIPEWPPELIARMKQLAGKYSFDFATEKLTVHKLSSVGVAGLTRIVNAIHKLEREYQKKQHQQIILQAEQPMDDLKRNLAALTIAAPLAEILPVSSSSSMAPSCSTDPIVVPNKRTTVKTKTRGKAHKRGQATPKMPTPVTPTCDAEKYGFSRSLFGMRAFHECRMRGDSSRVFYVVEGQIEASNKRGDNHQKFAGIIAEPKIVPPCGEEGFKWMKVDGRQVLVGKVLDTKKRLFPTVAQRNDQGAIAFLYGRIVNTKNGIPSQTVKHYQSAAKRKPS